MKTKTSFVCGALILTLGCAMVWAQATAQISGTAKDQSGAVLPGVEITVTQTDTGIARAAVTNETGSYVLPNLPSVRIGWRRRCRDSARMCRPESCCRSTAVRSINRSPGSGSGDRDRSKFRRTPRWWKRGASGVGQVVENARILELPLNGRQVVELIALAGAATPAPIVDGSGGRDPFGKGNVSVAGGLNTGLNYTLDGANHNNPYDNGYMSMPFPDALQEFKVETSATGAQNGVKSAGSVSLVTKSGTNEFHGDLFEFVRNGMFNARNAFATRRDTIKRNQFGGTVGGPIIKNKLFFFAGYQGTTIRQDPSDSHCVCSHRGDAGRRLYGLRLTGLQRRPADYVESSVRQQPHRSCAIQQTGRASSRANCRARRIRAAKSYYGNPTA